MQVFGRRVLCIVFAVVLESLSTASQSVAPGPDYDLKLMAAIGSTTSGGTLTAVDPYCSINDKGVIAFTGVDTQGSKAFVIQSGSVSGITSCRRWM